MGWVGVTSTRGVYVYVYGCVRRRTYTVYVYTVGLGWSRCGVSLPKGRTSTSEYLKQLVVVVVAKHVNRTKST